MKKLVHKFRFLYVPVHNWYYNTFHAPKRYHHLYDEIRKIGAKNILEIGVWNGKRAVKMIEVAKSANQDVRYYGFDLFENLSQELYESELSKKPPTLEEVKELISKTGANTNLFPGNTLESLPQNLGSLPKMDFIFIDGGHSNETVLSDWENCSKLMHSETIVIFDDYWRDRTDGGSKKTVDAISREKYEVEILPEIDSFDNPDFGKLDISFAKVTLLHDSAK